MNTLEPLCTGEQTEMLQKLGLNVLIDPTISLAKNWLYEKYGIWIYAHYILDSFSAYASKEHKYFFEKCLSSDNPYTAESDCLTEVLKKLTSEQ